jgi:hypothetical protein
MTYVGEWDLIPELSLYAVGIPPAAGRYTISRAADGHLALEVAWRMPDDVSDRSTRFGGPADGSRVALPASESGPDAFTLTHVADDTLDSAAYRGAHRQAYARRVVSADQTLLAVAQEIIGLDGTPLRNFQVYRRVSG